MNDDKDEKNSSLIYVIASSLIRKTGCQHLSVCLSVCFSFLPLFFFRFATRLLHCLSLFFFTNLSCYSVCVCVHSLFYLRFLSLFHLLFLLLLSLSFSQILFIFLILAQCKLKSLLDHSLHLHKVGISVNPFEFLAALNCKFVSQGNEI